MALTSTIRKWFEWLFGCWYEGPQSPSPRFASMITAFAHYHPRATENQWKSFALSLAEQAYRSGWQRGFEAEERGYGTQYSPTPEQLADSVSSEWRHREHGSRQHAITPDAGIIEVELLPERMNPLSLAHGRDQLEADLSFGKVGPSWPKRR